MVKRHQLKFEPIMVGLILIILDNAGLSFSFIVVEINRTPSEHSSQIFQSSLLSEDKGDIILNLLILSCPVTAAILQTSPIYKKPDIRTFLTSPGT